MNFNYQKLEKGDVEGGYDLLKENLLNFSWRVSDLEKAFTSNNHLLLGIFQKNQLIGMIHGSFLFNEGEILSIALTKKYQHQGLGTKLLEYFLAEIKKLGVDKVFLEVRTSNLSAKKLYEKNQFKKISQRKNYYHHPQETADIYLLEMKS